MKQVLVVGEGAWGTAISILLAHNGYTVFLWCHDPEVAHSIEEHNVNQRYFPDFMLSKAIIPVTNFKVLQEVEWIFQATPVIYLRSVIEQLKLYISPKHRWVMLNKGIEKETLLLPTQVVADVLGYVPDMVVLAGPSFAHELAKHDITSVILASQETQSASDVHSMLANEYFKSFVSSDVIGVQAGGALKNVITLAVGMLDGAGYGENAKAFLFTQGVQELKTMISALGGNPLTAYGLAGVGDLVLTAMGSQSRNLEVGRRLGKGENLATILEQTGYTPEGINTVKTVYQCMCQQNIALPLCAQIYNVIFNKGSIEDIIACLMAL